MGEGPFGYQGRLRADQVIDEEAGNEGTTGARRSTMCDKIRHDGASREGERLMKRPCILIALLAVSWTPLPWALPEAGAQVSRGQYGAVHFPISCRPGVQEQFERAVAMLHSFFYPEDVKAFEAIVAADPDCAMAYWGLAISQRPNPLVPPWAAESLKRGLDAVQKGKAVAKTERERDWLNALEQATQVTTPCRRPSAASVTNRRWSDWPPSTPTTRKRRSSMRSPCWRPSITLTRPPRGRSRRARSWSRSTGRSPTTQAWRTTSSTRTTSSPSRPGA